MKHLFRSLRSQRSVSRFTFVIEPNDPEIDDGLIWSISDQFTQNVLAYSANASFGDDYQAQFSEDAQRIVDALHACHRPRAPFQRTREPWFPAARDP